MRNIKLTFLALLSFFVGNQVSAQWEKLSSLNGYNIDNIVTAGQNMYVIANPVNNFGVNGIFLSTDNGETWIQKNNGLTGIIRFLVEKGTDIFAGTSEGIFRSDDNGNNWNSVNSGLTTTDVSSMAVSGVNLFAGTYGGGVFLSNDHGTTWNAANTGLTSNYVKSVIASDSCILTQAAGKIFLSVDDGLSWNIVYSDSEGYEGSNIVGPVTLLGSSIIVAHHYKSPSDGNIGSYYSYPFLTISTDLGVTWISNPAPPGLISSLLISGGNFIMTRHGDSCDNCEGGCDNCGSDIDQVSYSRNFGVSWTDASLGLPLDNMVGRYANCLAFDSVYMYLGSIEGLWRRPLTSRLGVLATPAMNTVKIGFGSDDLVSDVQIKVNEESLTVSQTGDLYFCNYSISTDDPITVSASAKDWLLNDVSISKTYSVSSLNKTAYFSNYAVTGSGSGYVLMSSDINQLTNLGRLTPVCSPVDFLNTKKNVLKIEALYDALSIERSITNFDESKIGIYQFQNDHWEYIGGHGENGKVSITIHSGKIAVFYNPDQTSIPKEFSLSQNYPNPFNPTTTIRYAVPAGSKVTLKVYNILGQEVRNLMNGYKDAGRYEIMWDGRNNSGNQVSSGVYLYRMEAGKFIQTKKMLFVK